MKLNYEEVLSAIHSRKTFSGGGATLSRISRLMEGLGNPQEDFKTVHVAGTNGKGSVSAMIHAGLAAAGYRTGLFTSPYLKDFRERICINGQMISQDELIHCYETVMAEETAFEQQGYEPINEFELVTAIGFLAFSRSKVDYVVLEVGLGGRTDPTNLVRHPAVCCIMPISLDHTAILGDTIEKIAAEKAGIIKDGCPVVISAQPEEAKKVFQKTAAKHLAPFYEAESVCPISMTKQGTGFLAGNIELFIPLLGAHQMENASAALRVLQLLGVDDTVIKNALAAVSWPGRLQYFADSEILVDSGHNEAGIRALCTALNTLFSDMPIIAVMAMMKDKDYGFCIPEIAKRAKLLIGTTTGLPRSLEPQSIVSAAKEFCPGFTTDSMEQAIKLAKSHAEAGDLILVCGSVYAAGDALKILN